MCREGSIVWQILYEALADAYICSTNSIDRALTSGLHRADRETSRAARYFLRSFNKESKKNKKRMKAIAKESGRFSSLRYFEKYPYVSSNFTYFPYCYSSP